jgi:hypothetical protein
VFHTEPHVSAGGLDILVEDFSPGFRSDGSNAKPGAGGELLHVARRPRPALGPDAELRTESGPNGKAVRFTVPIWGGASALRIWAPFPESRPLLLS